MTENILVKENRKEKTREYNRTIRLTVYFESKLYKAYIEIVNINKLSVYKSCINLFSSSFKGRGSILY